MTEKNDTISAWQTGILIFVLFFANKILVLPSLYVERAGILSFILPIVSFGCEFLLLFLFFLLKKKFPTQSLKQIVSKTLGKWAFVILMILIGVFFFGKTILLYDVTYIFFTSTVYQDGTNIMFLFCFVPIMIFFAMNSIKVLGRTAQLFFPVIVAIVLFCLVVGVIGIESVPLFQTTSFSALTQTWLRFVPAFGDSIILFLLIDKIKINKGQWNVVFSLAGASAIFVCAINVVFILLFTYTSFMHPFALFEIISYVKEVGGVGRIDIISMVVIVILTYFHLSIYLLAFKEAFVSIFGVKEVYAVSTFMLIFIVIVRYLVENLEKAIMFAQNYWPFFGSVAFVIVPIVVIISLFSKKEVDD